MTSSNSESFDTGAIREALNKAFDDPEFDAFCMDNFPEVYDKISRGGRKDEKIQLLLDYCRCRDNDRSRLIELLHQKGLRITSKENGFNLRFTNRESEKRMIRELLESGFYVQIYAPGGLGKTYLLREIQEEVRNEGWRTIWIDLASEEHRACRADRYKFMREFYQQIWVTAAPDIINHNEEDALNLIGRRLADFKKVVLFVDNADRWGNRFLSWIRDTFLEKLSGWSRLCVVASGQRVIPEWQGHRAGRPFHELPLSEFVDSAVISNILTDTVTRFGAKKVQIKQQNQPQAWQTDLETMIEGLFRVARGHPLAIERVLSYAVEKDGLVHTDFFNSSHVELCERCLAPIVDGRILPTVDRYVREAFRSLCVFRFVWPALIRTLTEPAMSEEYGGSWEPFSTGNKTWQNWWSGLQETHLIYDVGPRQMYPISPVVRQVIALVLQAEDDELYRARNRRARQEYEHLLKSPNVRLMWNYCRR